MQASLNIAVSTLLKKAGAMNFKIQMDFYVSTIEDI